MKELVPIDEFGIFANKSYEIRVDSRYVADTFGKEHKNVLRDIEALFDKDAEFSQLNFELIKYKDDNLKSHLPDAQVALIDKLYRIDQGLIYAIPDYHERKAKLQEIATNI